MRLSPELLEQFDRDGYLFFPSRFTPQEVDVLRAHRDRVFTMYRPEIVREKTSDAVRTAFAAHLYDDAFAALGAHPRLIDPVRDVLGDGLYMHQFKINAKAAFEGDQWQWHQDYGTWVNDDLMPEPRAMNISVFIDDVTPYNGPLMFIPGSHKGGVLNAGHDTTTTSYPLWTLDHDTVRTLANRGGIVAPTGPAGSMLMFHANLVHASPANMSPWDRTIVYLSLNRTDNAIKQFKRPDYIAHRDFTPIAVRADDCLSAMAVAHA
ncbi:MAG: phytanoyl-CoA dioxygenase family protein [Candidatus Velthaea sp.]